MTLPNRAVRQDAAAGFSLMELLIAAAIGAAVAAATGQCPQCGAAALIHQEGCDVCLNCGYSRCG